MSGVADRLNWDFVGRGNYEALVHTTGPRSHSRIPSQQFIANAPILMLGCRSATASPYWSLGCWASQVLLITPSVTSTFMATCHVERVACRLNMFTLIKFTDYQAGPYLLKIDIPHWIDQLEVEVWYYSGDELNPTLRDLEAIKSHLGI